MQMPIGLSLQRQIHSHLPMLTGWSSMKRTDLRSLKLIGSNLPTQIDSSLQMQIDSHLLKRIDSHSMKRIGWR